MALKTPISLLQEILVKQNQTPLYSEEPSDSPQYRFKYAVQCGTSISYGYGATKKEAKHKSAEEALKKNGFSSNLSTVLAKMSSGLIQDTVNKPIENASNYIGTLHEFASGRQIPYPQYTEGYCTTGQFLIKCHFMDFETEAMGFNKKQAKQQASKLMFEKVQAENVDYKLYQNYTNIGTDLLIEEVLTKYNLLSINNNNICSSKQSSTTDSKNLFNFEEKSYTLQEIIRLLENKGYHCKKEEIVKKDLRVVVIKLQNTNWVFMGTGRTAKDAEIDVANNISVMLKNDFTFKLPF